MPPRRGAGRRKSPADEGDRRWAGSARRSFRAANSHSAPVPEGSRQPRGPGTGRLSDKKASRVETYAKELARESDCRTSKQMGQSLAKAGTRNPETPKARTHEPRI